MTGILSGLLDLSGPAPVLRDIRAARAGIEELARLAVFGTDAERTQARYVIHETASQLGAYPASIHELYMARGRGEVGGFTVPAVNVRGMTFDVARALFRAMAVSSCGAAIFEINRAEVGFTRQHPAEFAACVLAAAVAEGHTGPVFLQGDHVQFNPEAYAASPEAETLAVERLVRDMVEARFYNIDIDASTLVDLRFARVEDQQALNAQLTARVATLVRSIEPAGVTISIGGEIGEVGAHNSTPEELIAYADGFGALFGAGRGPGLSKVSVQTGTTHGGIPLPGGGVAEVALDFPALERLGRLARERYGMAGAVQHGASTLPDDLFHLFPEAETAEVHLATGFQNLVMDHPRFPAGLLAGMRRWAAAELAGERGPAESDDQFFYRVRKKAWGQFKRETWDLAPDVKAAITASLQARFEFTIRELRASDTASMVRHYVGQAPTALSRHRS